MGLIEVGIGFGAVLMWLVGLFVFLYRGILLPGTVRDDLKFEVAEVRGLFVDRLESQGTLVGEEEARRRFEDAALENEAGPAGEQRRLTVWKAWRHDPAFKAEVQRRYRQRYPWRHAHIALLCGGAWSLMFVLSNPLQEALVPAGFDVLFPVYALVAPWWVAVAVMIVRERIKTMQRRSQSKRI
jgi:hypothetical protein